MENGGRFLGTNLQDLSATACLDYSSKVGAGHLSKSPKDMWEPYFKVIREKC